MLRVEPHGHDASMAQYPPRKRGLVIALGKRDQILIAFPYGNTELEGFHDHSEAWATERLGRLQTWTILHGAVYQATHEGKRTRTVAIYRAPFEDRKHFFGNDENSFPLTAIDRGKLDPEKFLNGPNFVPERIMQILTAKELHVVDGIASTSLYDIVKEARKGR